MDKVATETYIPTIDRSTYQPRDETTKSNEKAISKKVD
jgi:hypothetical protein